MPTSPRWVRPSTRAMFRSSFWARDRTSWWPTPGSRGSSCGSVGAIGGWLATGERLTVGASMPLPALANVALRHGLAGLEFGVAIPASVGGAIRMNAGAHGAPMAEVLEQVHVFDLASGRALSIPAAEAGFVYRGSALAG